MDKKTIFYGTPLSKSLASVIDDDVGSSNSRKFRLNQQQTVRDAQGRQRFHGAFTGGFSAGYFNTVDSAAGFQPKTFTSQRHRQSNHGPSSSFSHKPEDYMDEEDLGEFGIAPKKIRVSRQFAAKESNPSARSDQCLSGALFNLIQPVDISIGERILKCITGQSGPRVDRSRNEKIAQIKLQNKSDFHGLGYKPLNYNKTSESDVFNRTNPLTAVLDKGRKLKISGEAFGSGVLDEDDDCLLTGDMYGYDDIKNYTFSSTKEVNPQRQFPTEKQLGQDFISITGFVPSTRDDKSERFCLDSYNKYLAPQVPDNWCAPTRPEPRELLNKDHSRVYRDLKDAQSLMSKKFTTGSEKYQTTGTEKKSGLLQYSDLKAAESSSADDTLYSDKPVECATVTRQTLEWRPCSLLCKRFNVPIPFLDQLAVRTVQTDQDLRKSQQIDFEKIDLPVQELASLELKQSIFDVTFYNDNFIEETRGDSSIDSEDEPQIVENSELIDHQKVASSDEDVEVVVVPKLEPEIITLSSSSSPSSSTPSPPPIKLQKMSDEHDSDAYGPPLPPTLKTLIELDHRRQTSDTTSGRRHRKKKNRKHRKHKRID